jgi:ParB family chromosome partitioning protein
MTQKKRGLSRGLDALLAGTGLMHTTTVDKTPLPLTPTSTKPATKSTKKTNNINQAKKIPVAANTDNTAMVTSLKIAQLSPGKFQPRRAIPPEELAELVESIKTQGILQPLIVRKLTANSYEIIAGERRWQAAKLAKLQSVPTIVKQVNDQDALTIALIENIQRENLNPLDEAIALDRLTKEFCLTHNQVAAAVGKSRTGITNLLRVLQLPADIKALLEANKITLGHAKVILGAPNKFQLPLATKIVEQSLSVRAAEILLTQYQNLTNNFQQDNLQSGTAGVDKDKLDPDIKQLQQKLSDTLGAKVSIANKSNGSGKLIIKYNSLDELDGILEHIKISESY